MLTFCPFRPQAVRQFFLNMVLNAPISHLERWRSTCWVASMPISSTTTARTRSVTSVVMTDDASWPLARLHASVCSHDTTVYVAPCIVPVCITCSG